LYVLDERVVKIFYPFFPLLCCPGCSQTSRDPPDSAIPLIEATMLGSIFKLVCFLIVELFLDTSYFSNTCFFENIFFHFVAYFLYSLGDTFFREKRFLVVL
jgi:hypothetical protein